MLISNPTCRLPADTTAPTVTLTTPADPVTEMFVVTAQFSETVTGITDADFVVTNATTANFVAVDGDTYTIEVTPTATPVTIDMSANAGKDLAENDSTAATQLSVTYNTPIPAAPTDVAVVEFIPDTTQPTVNLTTPSNSVTGMFVMTATFSEPVTGMSASQFTDTSGVATFGNYSAASTTVYTIEVTPPANTSGTIDVNLNITDVTDAAGNETISTTNYSVSFSSAVPNSPTNVAAVEFTQS